MGTLSVSAMQGNSGYEGGISSGQTTKNDTYEYEEVVFITGEPKEFIGTVNIRRREQNDMETVTYVYSLTNGQNNRLNRTVVLDTTVEDNNNQIIRETVLNNLTETITLDGTRYTVDQNRRVSFSMSTITDVRPAVDYLAGSWSGVKTYGTNNGQRITVRSTGQLYGYDQHWGNAETQEIRLYIESRNLNDAQDSWGGSVDIKVSSTSMQLLLYVDNPPIASSIDGGYLQRRENNNVLTYTARLPEFDAQGQATDRMLTHNGDSSQESFPNHRYLPIYDLRHIRGHWYEDNVKQLYSLGIYDDGPQNFIPNQYMTRAEFAKAIVRAGEIKIEEKEPAGRVNPRLQQNQQQEEKASPYIDVPTNHAYFKYIDALYQNGAMQGYGERFHPDDIITRAQALTIFIRILGFESLAPNPGAVTIFVDNDDIPDWARNSVAVASYIGLARGDDRGRINPNDPMTKAEASAFLNRLINYMRHDIVRDYRDRVFIY